MATEEGSIQGRHPIPGLGSAIPLKRQLSINKTKTKVTRACDICKTKKSKCSGEQPCQTCSRRGLECQYDSAYSRGKAPPPRRSEARSEARTPSLVVELDTRATFQQPEQHQSAAEHMIQRMDVDVDVQPDSDRAPEIPSRGSPGLEVAGQYTDPTSGLSFLHRAWRRISNNETSQVMNGQLASADEDQLLSCAGDKPLQADGEVQLPQTDRCLVLLALYFDVCIATYRLLHRPTTKSWLLIVAENAANQRSLFAELGRAKTATVLSVLAVASFHEEKAKGGNVASPLGGELVISESDQLFNEAVRLSNEETGFPRLESAQSRLIQVLYLLMSCRFNQAWYTFGHALQIISALGLHRRDDRKRAVHALRRDYIDGQCRKRTFWVAYTLDKYLGTIFGRPRHYHDEDIDQDFPDPINDEDMTSAGAQQTGSDDCHTESLIFHAKLAQIAEKISREVYSIKPIPDEARLAASHRLGAELRQWRASLPPFLGAINPSSLIPSFRRQANALKLSYCHTVMLAHRPFLLKNKTRDSENMKRLAKESLTECIAAARSVLEAVDRMANEGRLFHAFWWTHYVCFCALVVVYVWAIQESGDTSSLSERRIILDQAERCLQHLAQATASNSPSRKYSIILQELRAEAKRKTARPIQEQMQAARSLAAIAGAGHYDPNNAREDHVGPENEAAVQVWQPLFGSPIDTSTPGLQNFLDDWQTTDWLHLDASAFGPFVDADYTSLNWMESMT